MTKGDRYEPLAISNYKFKLGDKNQVIYQIKRFLQSQTCVECDLKSDNIFDASTQTAITAFQKQRKLKIQDGTLTYETYEAIGRAMHPVEREIITTNNLHFNILLAGMTVDEYDDCRLKALKKMAEELGAKADDYDTTADKIQDVGVGVALGAAGGAAGGVVGAAIGGTLGGFAGVYAFSVKEQRIERPIVDRFWKAEVRCQAVLEEILNQGPSMGAATDKSKNFFVVTRQYGTFALYPYYKFIGYNTDRANGKEVQVPKYIITPPSPMNQFNKNTNPYIR